MVKQVKMLVRTTTLSAAKPLSELDKALKALAGGRAAARKAIVSLEAAAHRRG
jgi:hypothetical protein